VRTVARAGVVAALAVTLLLVHVGMQAGDGHPVAPPDTLAAAHQTAAAHHSATAAPIAPVGEPAGPAGDTHLMASLCLAILAATAAVAAFRAPRASRPLDRVLPPVRMVTWHVARGRPPDPGRLRIDTGTVLLV
jgi:hypothetical protein